MANEIVRYMLDTNTVSYFIKGSENVRKRVTAVPISALCISAITKGELLFGLEKRANATPLVLLVQEFLRRVDVLPWDSIVAEQYGVLRATMQQAGKSLGNLDMLIAAHALESSTVLVTSDRAFSQVEGLRIEDWVR